MRTPVPNVRCTIQLPSEQVCFTDPFSQTDRLLPEETVYEHTYKDNGRICLFFSSNGTKTLVGRQT